MKLILKTSKRSDGSMGFVRDYHTPEAIKNRKRFFQKLEISKNQVIRCGQIHSSRVVIIKKLPVNPVRGKTLASAAPLARTSNGVKSFVANTDALVTNQPNTYLSILTADCFPVFFYSPSPNSSIESSMKAKRISLRSSSKMSVGELPLPAVGIAHAGWRGTIKGIIPNTINSVKKYLGAKPGDIKVVIGPGIQKCHFEVKDDVARLFQNYKKFILEKKRKIYIDLPSVITNQLISNGINPKNISSTKKCTYHERKLYFSHRRDKSEKHPYGFGQMLSVIGLMIEK